MSIKSVMPSNHLILCGPLLLLPSFFPRIRVFPNESVLCIRWPKYWSFSFNISPSNEYSGLISFRIDWFNLLAAQGSLKSLLQHHSSKASILQHSAFFIVQLSHPYMTTGKATALIRRTFVCKVMFLLFNMLSRLVIASYPSPLDGRQTEKHNHRKITNLITRTTALSNSMKLWAMPCRTTQDRWVTVESSDKVRPTGEWNGKPLQYSCLENPINRWKDKKIGHWKMNSQGW